MTKDRMLSLCLLMFRLYFFLPPWGRYQEVWQNPIWCTILATLTYFFVILRADCRIFAFDLVSLGLFCLGLASLLLILNAVTLLWLLLFHVPWSRLPPHPLTPTAGGQGLPTGRWRRELKGSLWRDWRFHPKEIRTGWPTYPRIFTTMEGSQLGCPWGTEGMAWGAAGPCRRGTPAPRSSGTASATPCTGAAPSGDTPAWGLPVMLSSMVPTPALLSLCTSLATAAAWATSWRRRTTWPRRAPWDKWGPRPRPACRRTGTLWGPASTKPPSETPRAGGRFPSQLP